MTRIPQLPAVVVTALGMLSTVLMAAGPGLSSPWREVAAAVVALLAAAGVVQTNRAIRAHGEASRSAGFAAGWDDRSAHRS